MGNIVDRSFVVQRTERMTKGPAPPVEPNEAAPARVIGITWRARLVIARASRPDFGRLIRSTDWDMLCPPPEIIHVAPADNHARGRSVRLPGRAPLAGFRQHRRRAAREPRRPAPRL